MAIGYAAAALFAAAILVHFIAAVRGLEALRCITKALLMPLLAVTFVLFWTEFTPAPLPWRVALGLIAGCAGDIALLDHRNAVGLSVGLAFFFVGHVLYIGQLYGLMTPPPGWWIAVAAVIVLSVLWQIFRKLRHFLPKLQLFAGPLYFLLLGTLSASAALDAFATLNAGSFLLLGGTLLFLLSDTFLAFEVFRGETRHSYVKVMAPYIAAQTLIAAGFFLRMI